MNEKIDPDTMQYLESLGRNTVLGDVREVVLALRFAPSDPGGYIRETERKLLEIIEKHGRKP